MRMLRYVPLWAAVLMTVLTAAPSRADNNPNGMSFRAVGWFKGKAEITQGRINCEIPSVNNAISEGAFVMGLWNTYGRQTIYYPDINNEFGNPCGGWIQLQNNMIDQAVNLDHINLRYRIQGAKRFKSDVPTKNQFPMACRQFRNETHYVGNRINPVNSTEDTSSSGAPNVAFIELLPLVTPQLISCLRDAYTSLPNTVFTSLPLVIRATAYGEADSGSNFKSNTIQYTLTLRHTCGNGRIDDGELCDPNPLAPNGCFGGCSNGRCTQSDSLACTTDADCVGTCLPQNSPSECICVY